ncbi:phage minor capsid protein [Shouchella patagoniensis]|uniref:phage minor capsid protein n=1 Tax=Shouchella patagoniensis TaxID=228576 RepID=UPI000994A7E0|nr:phage minor capsid protein [Shouchella patagoniensis]
MTQYNSPKPRYNAEVNRIRSAYQAGAQKVLRELDRLDVSNMSRQQSVAALANITRTLKKLDAEGRKWADENIPLAAQQGIERAIITLGEAKSIDEARKLASFNRPNENMVAAAISDTQQSLLAVTQNINRKTRTAIRSVTAESMRENMAAGINGRKGIRSDILSKLRLELGDSLNTGIIDAGGRRWSPTHYVDMATRTKLFDAYDEANRNEGIMRGALYAVISSHGAIDACRFHEGSIVKLTADAPGPYPTIDELKASGQIFHPNCRHSYSVIRDPMLLPEDIRRHALEQDSIAKQALATGQRNPNIDDDLFNADSGLIFM